jgi:predicted dehydrogenase
MPGVAVVGQLEEVPGFAAVIAGRQRPNDDLEALLREVDAVLISVPTSMHYQVAQAAARRGVHLFVEWPPTTSLRECEAVVRLAEEAGIEAGLSRPLRFHPVFSRLPPSWQARLVLVRQALSREAPDWQRHLADALDLCCALVRSYGVQRIEAEAVRPDATLPEAVAFGIRFHNGAYAQVQLRHHEAWAGGTCYIGGAGFQGEADLPGEPPQAAPSEPASTADSLLAAETRAFIEAVAARRAVPVSMLDGLHTMRLVERLMKHLR